MNDYICWVADLDTWGDGWYYKDSTAERAAERFAQDAWMDRDFGDKRFEFQVYVRKNGEKFDRLFDIFVLFEPEFEVYEVRNNLKLKKEA